MANYRIRKNSDGTVNLSAEIYLGGNQRRFAHAPNVVRTDIGTSLDELSAWVNAQRPKRTKFQAGPVSATRGEI